MATAAFEIPALHRPRVGLVVASPPRSSLSIRRGEARPALGRLPGFSGLRASRPQKVHSAAGGADPNPDPRQSSVSCDLQDAATDTEVPDLTKDTWQSHVLQCQKPVVVEFWAPWCGPCRTIHPVITKLAKTYEGKLECFKMNTDEFPDLASEYGVKSIPTIILFKNGEKKDAVIGAVPEATLISCIDKFLGR